MTRCSAASRERGEPLTATASTHACFLLLEDPGPWGPQVLHTSRLPDALRAVLRAAQRDLNVRPLLIRRPGRTASGPRRVIAVNAHLRWAESTLVADLAEVADWDLSRFSGAAGLGLPAHPDPVVAVCTHGRHDPCCAERGRPLAAALAARFGDPVWEASHLGGDRFAGNVLLLPHGDYFGRLDPETGPRVVAEYLQGRLDLDHHRGRSTRRWEVQAAEAAARRALGVRGLDAVRVTGVAGTRPEVEVGLLVDGEPVDARVRVLRADPASLTCHAERPEGAPRYEVSLRPGS